MKKLWIQKMWTNGKIENKEITKIISKDKNINTKVSTDKTANIIIGINIIKANKGYKINQKDYIGKMLNSNINNTKITRTSYINVKLEVRENSEKINKKKKLIIKDWLDLHYMYQQKTRSDTAFAVCLKRSSEVFPFQINLIVKVFFFFL